MNGNTAFAEYLIKAGAKLNTEDDQHKTPLDYAKQYGHNEITILLSSNKKQKLSQ